MGGSAVHIFLYLRLFSLRLANGRREGSDETTTHAPSLSFVFSGCLTMHGMRGMDGILPTAWSLLSCHWNPFGCVPSVYVQPGWKVGRGHVPQGKKEKNTTKKPVKHLVFSPCIPSSFSPFFLVVTFLSPCIRLADCSELRKGNASHRMQLLAIRGLHSTQQRSSVPEL